MNLRYVATERTGIGETARRRDFLHAFEQAYYLRGLFLIRRPSLIPEERGCILMRASVPAGPVAAGGPGLSPWRVFKLARSGGSGGGGDGVGQGQGFVFLRAFGGLPGRADLGYLPL